jgi:hypothetical protein
MAFIEQDIYQPQLPATEAQDLLDNLIEEVQFTGNRDEFLDLIRKIESDNKIMATPKTTTAKGVYQFTDASVDTAKKRAINLGFDKATINLIPDNPQQWTDDEADIIALANLFAQSKAMQDAYYMLHHTNKKAPGTQQRVEEVMPLIGPLMNYNFPDKK